MNEMKWTPADLRAPYTVMHHAMRQVFEVCGAIHVMHHAHEASMKRIRLVWYFVGGASCKDRCTRCVWCRFMSGISFLQLLSAVKVARLWTRVTRLINEWRYKHKYMKTFICNYFKIFYKYNNIFSNIL